MFNPGFVYILINASLEGLLKIGKTNRTPDERAKELSIATGVPTPFMVAFDEQFDDCDLAEQYIHTLLQQRGYRVADNREFFNMPLKDAVRVLLEAKSTLSAQKAQLMETATTENFSKSEQHSEPWQDVFEQAEAYRYGLGDTLADAKRAVTLYKQAATLGSVTACLRLGEVYEYGIGCEQSNDKALDYLKEAARLGDANAYTPMAKLYYKLGQYANADKCWKRYFSYLADSNSETRQGAEEHIMEYVNQVRLGWMPYNYQDKIKDILGSRYEKILAMIQSAESIQPGSKAWNSIQEYALNALLSLGYQRTASEQAIKKAIDEGGDLGYELIIRRSLRQLEKLNSRIR